MYLLLGRNTKLIRTGIVLDFRTGPYIYLEALGPPALGLEKGFY